MVLELWDIGIFFSMAIDRQLNLEALTVNAPPPPLLYPLPGGAIMDDHRRKRRDEAELQASPLSATTRRFSLLKRVPTNKSASRDTLVIWGWKFPLWLEKLPRLVGSAAHSLVSDYIFHQPTIVLVWIFIALIIVHYFFWWDHTVRSDSHDAEMAAAAIVGWLFLVRAERGP